MQKIVVVPYNPQWPLKFQAEKSLIEGAVKDNLVALYHIGSTSVPKLKAKPIIDMLLIVEDINKLDEESLVFEKMDYEVMGEFGISGRRYYRKGGNHRSHQIHAFQFDQLYDIQRHLAFRDYLRAHDNVAQEYGELKETLALLYPESIADYGDGKDAFVKHTEKAALIWEWQNRE